MAKKKTEEQKPETSTVEETIEFTLENRDKLENVSYNLKQALEQLNELSVNVDLFNETVSTNNAKIESLQDALNKFDPTSIPEVQEQCFAGVPSEEIFKKCLEVSTEAVMKIHSPTMGQTDNESRFDKMGNHIVSHARKLHKAIAEHLMK